MTRRVLALFFGLQLLVFAASILTGARFNATRPSSWIIAILGIVLFLAAILALTVWRNKSRLFRLSSITAAALVTLRFYSPAAFTLAFPPEMPVERMAATASPDLGAYLRELADAQEQYRLRKGIYAESAASLSEWTRAHDGVRVTLTSRGSLGWRGVVSHADTVCTMWVRDSLLKTHAWEVEGSPVCGAPDLRSAHQSINTILAPPYLETGFRSSDIRGQWHQHRSDERRTAIVGDSPDTAGHTWTKSIGGPLRSSVAIAGNQVFVGAHTNGEIVALSLDSGKVGYRIRAPNWVHHEPVITENLVIFGFGNNEPSNIDPAFVGSPPSGIVAYDRLSGREMWRRYTAGSVMGSPVFIDNVVAVVTGGREAVAWRVSNGAQLWRTPLDEYAPMTNPALVDSLMFVGVEPAELCAIVLRSGVKRFCHKLDDDGKGAGHSSPAVANGLVLQVYEEDLDRTGGKPDSRVVAALRRVVGMPPKRFHHRPPNALRQQIMVALRVKDGTEVWRTSLGKGRTIQLGHNAGTPVIAGNTVYVPSPVSEAISGVDLATGALRWFARVKPSRGSVLVVGKSIVAATKDSGLVVLDASTGKERCRQRLPQRADRAGPTVSGGTGILTLTGGMVMARPIRAWLRCAV